MVETGKTASLLIVGNEILSGRTQDKNTNWLAEQLGEMGIVMQEVRIIPDIEEVIVESLNALRKTVDYVFTTGGIGPTHDDITAESVAKAFDVSLERNPDAYQALLDHYKDEAELTHARLKMAMVPHGAELIHNPVSGAPGFRIDNVYVMAGVPKIMQGMFHGIRSGLETGKPILSETVSCNSAESVIAGALQTIQDKYPNIDIGSYPSYRDGKPHVNIILHGTDEGDIKNSVQEVQEAVGRCVA